MRVRSRDIAILALAVPLSAAGQDRTFRRLPDDAGLSHNSVHAIQQDEAGFLWVGTADGLNRFDGYAFRVYRRETGDTTTLSSNLVWDILEAGDGSLWIATGAGVDRYEATRDAFTRVPGPFDANAMPLWRTRLHQARDGTLRAVTPAGLLRLTSGRFEPDPLGGVAGSITIRELAEDPDGRLWARRQDGSVVALADGASAPVSAGSVAAFLFDRHGELHTTLPGVPGGTPPGAPVTTALIESRDGTVWHGTTAGLVPVDSLGRAGPTYHLGGSRQGYIFDYVQALFEDRSGTLWVGTNGGLVRSDPHAKAFHHLGGDPDHPARLSASAVSAVSADADAVWAGTLGAGLNRIDRATGRIERWRYASATSSDPRDVIWAVHRDRRGTLWVGAGAGLLRLDERTRQLRPVPIPGSPGSVQVIGEDAAGMLWLLGAGRLVRLDPVTGRADVVRLRQALGADAPGVRLILESLLIARNGSVWVGAGSSTLVRVDPRTLAAARVPIAVDDQPVEGALAIWDLHEDPSGVIWAGMGSGLGRYDPVSGAFRFFTTTDGLPGAVVFSIEGAPDGTLWLGTNQGLARVAFSGDRIQVRTYVMADGTGSLEFNRRASFVDAAGEFFFGGVSGLTRFVPSEIRANPVAPPVVFTAIQSIGPGGTHQHGQGSLVLRHDENTVSVEFAALSFTNPALNRYRYRLRGVDRDWVDAGTRRYARYAGLAPGRYELAVTGTNEDGVWSEAPAVIAVTILPPFWETWWFRTILVTLLGAGAVAAYRARVSQLLAVERLRLRIAGDLHDDLASDLTGIALLGESVQRARGLGDAERDVMVRITDAARRLSRDVRDIVWAVDPGHDRSTDLAHHLREVAAVLLADVPHSFTLDGTVADQVLSMQVRRQVVLVFKEALHNVQRHARATHVRITFGMRAGALTLSVVDNGQGFVNDGLSHRFGLGQLRNRAEAIGGSVRVTSTPGAGTTVRLDVPLAPSARRQRMA